MSETAIENWECPVCFPPRDKVEGTVRPKCKHEQYFDYQPPTEEQYLWAYMIAKQLEPFMEFSSDNGLRNIRPPSSLYPHRAEQRREQRLVNRHKLSSLVRMFGYKILLKLLQAPAVYEGTTDVIPPAAINSYAENGKLRVRQARILGLQRASEAERKAKEDKIALRVATKGAALGSIACDYDARTAAIKVFRGIKPPMKKFRIGDYHQPSDGPMGKCVGHHLWLYDDGTYIRKGVKLPARATVL